MPLCVLVLYWGFVPLLEGGGLVGGSKSSPDMVDDLSLQIQHRTDVVSAIKLHGPVCAGQTVVTLDATECAVQAHLTGPGQNCSLARVSQ